MHSEFSDWYRAAAVHPTAELLLARWKAVEALADAIDGDTFYALLAALPSSSTLTARRKLTELIQPHDTTFPGQGNEQELRIVAAAVLRQVVESDGDEAAACALALACAAYGQSVVSPVAMHADQALLALRGISERARNAALPSCTISITAKRQAELLPPTYFQALETAQPAVLKLFDEFTARANAVLQALGDKVSLQQEELNFLWWLQNRYSKDLRVPFSGVSPDAAPIVFASELADLTTVAPGPTAVDGLLNAALEIAPAAQAILSIQASINALGRDWREHKTSDLDPGLLIVTPISLAMAKSLATAGEEDWLPVYAQAGGIDSREGRPRHEIASQFYLERMLALAATSVF